MKRKITIIFWNNDTLKNNFSVSKAFFVISEFFCQ